MKRHSYVKAIVGCVLFLGSGWAAAQKDPGVRGGLANSGGGLQQRGIPIPHPPLISPNPTTKVPVNENERASFEEGILRAGGGGLVGHWSASLVSMPRRSMSARYIGAPP